MILCLQWRFIRLNHYYYHHYHRYHYQHHRDHYYYHYHYHHHHHHRYHLDNRNYVMTINIVFHYDSNHLFHSAYIIEKSGLISTKLCKILLTTVALSMALTPFLAETGAKIAKKIEENMGLTHYLITETLDPLIDTATSSKHSESKSSSSGSNSIQGDFVFICGYGKVGQIICEMLDRKFIPYVVIENSPQKAIEARNKGLPVYFGK